MKVIATAPGFFANCRRRQGDVFDVPDGTKAKWFVPFTAPVAQAPAAATVAKPAPKVIKVAKATKGAGDLV